jgi:hypothetical protein
MLAMKQIRHLAAVVAVMASPALAQSPAPDTKACNPGERLQQTDQGPKAPAATTGENLSDKLARTDGIICPPAANPDMRIPAPEAGKTPVIPPPGTPGGDQSVQPK